MANPVVLVALGCSAALLLRRRRRRPRVRARSPVAVAPPPPSRVQLIEGILCDCVTDEPQPNRFYQCQYGDSLDDIARAALGTIGESNAAQRLEYIHCMAGGQYNLDKYGTPSTSRTHPPRYLLPGLGLGIRAALLPRNDDALALMLSGLAPVMRVDPKTGAPTSNASSRGLIWLPPVDPTAFLERGEVTCGDADLDPPAELLDLLQEAA